MSSTFEQRFFVEIHQILVPVVPHHFSAKSVDQSQVRRTTTSQCHTCRVFPASSNELRRFRCQLQPSFDMKEKIVIDLFSHNKQSLILAGDLAKPVGSLSTRFFLYNFEMNAATLDKCFKLKPVPITMCWTYPISGGTAKQQMSVILWSFSTCISGYIFWQRPDAYKLNSPPPSHAHQTRLPDLGRVKRGIFPVVQRCWIL